jgi:MarR family transcriptional repressor of mepA
MGDCEKYKNFIDKNWAKTYNVVSCLTNGGDTMKYSILFQIKLLQNLIVRNICRDMKKHNIISPPSQVQASVIGYLIRNEGKEIYQKDLEGVLKLRRSTISGILKTLEKNGFVKRVDSKKDARVKKIILTEEANKLYKGANQYLEQLEKRITANIKTEDLKVFCEVLEKMQQNIDVK